MQVLVNGRGENMKGELLKSVACRKGMHLHRESWWTIRNIRIVKNVLYEVKKSWLGRK